MYTKKGFTLVELIVVITILAVLATVWFISFLGYASFARDGTRLTDIWIINHGLEYHKIEWSRLPQPDNAIPITVSGSIVAYQWEAWKSVLGLIWVQWWQDPLEWSYYSYFLRKNYAQVLALFENEQNKSVAGINKWQTYADNLDRFPYYKWWWLGMFLENDNTPIHQSNDIQLAWEFDILNASFMSREVQPLFSNNTRYTTRAIMIGGQLSVDPIVKWIKNCPEYYIPVPWNKELWQPDFCIWKYEASSSNGNTTWIYNSAPWNMPVIEMDDSITFPNCTDNWDNYHIMTMMEWLTVARNIEMVSDNWSWWEVTNWFIYWWNNSDNVTGFDNIWVKLAWWPSWNIIQDQLRQLKLSNGEIIWDFIWNVAEAVKWLNTHHLDGNEFTLLRQTSWPLSDALDQTWIQGISNSDSWYKNWEDITDIHFKTMYWPRSWATTSQWLWAISQYKKRAFAMWGYAVSSHTAPQWAQWLFSLIRLTNPNNSQIWTRCAYSY
jgi:prepilin-type N-terminal cleavage/methylation domain-containing protein